MTRPVRRLLASADGQGGAVWGRLCREVRVAHYDGPGLGLGLRAAAAKVYCCEAAMQTAAEMIQLHGAIGIIWEHPAHRYLKQAHGALRLFGGSAVRPSTPRAIAASLIG